MSIYIHSKNQELLWSTMMKVPLFKLQHADHPNQIVFWFRNVIGMFYDKYRDVPLQVQDLQKINRETVAYMVQSLQKNAEPVPLSGPVPLQGPVQAHLPTGPVPLQGHVPLPGPVPLQSHSVTPFYQVGNLHLPANSIDTFENKTVTRNYILEQKQAEFTHQFSERQKEYDQMLKGPAVQEIDFRMVDPDQPIENMEELIQQHMKSREEIVKFAAPPLQPPSSDSIHNNTKDTTQVHWTKPLDQTVTLTNVEDISDIGNKTVVETSTTTLDPASVLSFMAETRQFMEQTRAFMVQAQSFQGRSTLIDTDNVYLAKRSSSF